MRYKYWLVFLLLCSLMVFVPQPARADAVDQLVGTYNVAGWNPDKDIAGAPDYKGEMTITAKGRLLEIVWHTGGPPVTGVGLVRKIGEGWVLSVSYMIQDRMGIAVYEISITNGNVLLAGLWGAAGSGIGHEVCTRAAAAT